MKVTEQVSDSNVMMDDELYLNTLREIESIALEKVYTGEIEPISWSDVVSTIKLANEQRRLILGKPTSKVETTISVEISGLNNDELDKRLEETQRAVAYLNLERLSNRHEKIHMHFLNYGNGFECPLEICISIA